MAIRRALFLLCVIAALMFSACSGKNDNADMSSDALSRAVDDMTDESGLDMTINSNFSDIGTSGSLSASSSLESDASQPVALSTAYNAYSEALRTTYALKSYKCSGSQSFSMVIDGSSAELEKTAFEALSDGDNCLFVEQSTSKDSHNRQLSSAERGIYADKNSDFSVEYSKYTDFTDEDNNSTIKIPDSYSAVALSQPLKNCVIEFSKSDVENVSAGNGGSYTFSLNSAKGAKIISSILEQISVGEQSQQVSVSYFVVTVQLQSGLITSYDCEVFCNIGSNTMYKIAAEFSLSLFDSDKDKINTPDWAK